MIGLLKQSLVNQDTVMKQKILTSDWCKAKAVTDFHESDSKAASWYVLNLETMKPVVDMISEESMMMMKCISLKKEKGC